jgi:hypothetical protein
VPCAIERLGVSYQFAVMDRLGDCRDSENPIAVRCSESYAKNACSSLERSCFASSRELAGSASFPVATASGEMEAPLKIRNANNHQIEQLK